MTSEEKYAAVRLMQQIGGSFVKALAEAYRRADAQNAARIEGAFPEIFADYAERAKPIEWPERRDVS